MKNVFMSRIKAFVKRCVRRKRGLTVLLPPLFLFQEVGHV